MQVLRAEDFIDPNENIMLEKRHQNRQVHQHQHDFIEIVYILEGNSTQTINGKKYAVRRGDLLFFNFHDWHAAVSREDVQVINILLKPFFVSNELLHCHDALDILALTSFHEFEDTLEKFPPRIRFSGMEIPEIESILESMLQEFNGKAIGYRAVLQGYLHVLIAKIFRAMGAGKSGEVQDDMHRLMPGILEYIEKSYHQKITLGELARTSFYNPSYFGQIFKECFHMTPMEYINRKRMAEAARLLQEQNLSAEQICHRVGYRDKKQFYRLFRQYTGQTPGQFRSGKSCRLQEP